MDLKYGIFFTRDGQVIRLPQNPEKLPQSLEGANDEYNVMGVGPITVPRTPKQKQVEISGYFPGRPNPFTLTTGGFQPPEFYIQFFENAMYDKAPILYTPVRYYEDGEPFGIQDPGFLVLVDSFSTQERGGETGDFYYDLSLVEYRDYSPQTLEVQKPKTPASPAKAKAKPSRSIPKGQLYVGAAVIANGPYYYSSYGDEPHGTASGKNCKVSRIVADDPTRPCPVLIATESGGALGWMKKEALQVVEKS